MERLHPMMKYGNFIEVYNNSYLIVSRHIRYQRYAHWVVFYPQNIPPNKDVHMTHMKYINQSHIYYVHVVDL